MYLRTVRLTTGTGEMEDLLLRIDQDVAPITSTSPGFLGYYAVAVDSTSLITTRVFNDKNALDAETAASAPPSQVIFNDFALTIELVVEGEVGVGYGFGPMSIFTP